MQAVLYTLLTLFVIVGACWALLYRPDLSPRSLEREYADDASRFTQFDGLRLHYRDEGQDDPMVLLHGLTATVHPVLTRGAGDTVEIPMVRTAAKDAASAGSPEEAGAAGAGDEAALVGPTWVAEDIGGGGVIDYLQSHITFTAEGQAHGFGGCNNFTGGYALAGATLALGPLASTKKACPPAIMNQETRFHQALGKVRGYRFENGLLILLDAQSVPVMRLWPRD